jgi:hypothetical protein
MILKGSLKKEIDFREVEKIICTKICPLIKEIHDDKTDLFTGITGYLHSLLLLVSNIQSVETKQNKA